MCRIKMFTSLLPKAGDKILQLLWADHGPSIPPWYVVTGGEHTTYAHSSRGS